MPYIPIYEYRGFTGLYGILLGKIYYVYYRLSEDLDFSMRLPEYEVTRSKRRKCIQPVKDKIEEFAKKFGMIVDNVGSPGRNESKQSF